jgi:hypothetical protein
VELERTSLSLAALKSFSEREKEAVTRPVTRNALVRKKKRDRQERSLFFFFLIFIYSC